MAAVRDFEGREVRLTEERWEHISEHPEMRSALEETLRFPEVVVQSQSDPSARLHYRFYQRTIVAGKYMCVVVKISGDDAFVVTAYLTDRIKKGETVWPKEP